MGKEKVLFTSALFLFLTHCLLAQNQVSHFVIGNIGSHSHGSDVSLSSTVGEVSIQTGFGSASIITAGFHQPRWFLQPELYVSSTDVSCQGQSDGSVMIDSIIGCSGPFQITWNTGDTTMVVQGLPPGFYSVNVQSSDCDLNADVFVGTENDGPCQLHIYTGITPNNDGHNDQWIIDRIDLFQPNRVNIFNRWGQLIWNAENYNNNDVVWEGKDNSERDLPDGTYFYVLELSTQTFKGYVELTR